MPCPAVELLLRSHLLGSCDVFGTAVVCAFVATMLTAAISDVARYTIPNRISLALVGLFCIAAPLSGLDWAVIGQHAAIGFAVLLGGFVLFQLGYVGGGDAKLLAAGALWFGPQAIATYGLGIALMGGLLCAVILGYRSLPLPVVSIGWLNKLHDPAEGVPYGVAIAAGAIAALPETQWMALAFAA